MELFHVRVFSEDRFLGNTASVVVFDDFLPDEVLQKMALENGTSETGFVTRGESLNRIRWFSSVQEVSMCGHGTLAAAFVLFEKYGFNKTKPIFFKTNTDILSVCLDDFGLTLQAPARKLSAVTLFPLLVQGLGREPLEVYLGTSMVAVFRKEEDLSSLQTNNAALEELCKDLNLRSIIVTAPGQKADYVLRYFTPLEKTKEDPATGVAQCLLTPYWAKKLDKCDFLVHQLSAHGGVLRTRLDNDTVFITGSVALYEPLKNTR